MTTATLRTDEEIIARLKDERRLDPFGFGVSDLVPLLPFEKARPWLKEGVTADEWRVDARDRYSVIERMRDYMPFAWDKALDHRGLSASRSITHFKEWLWLLGDDETLAFAEDDSNYANYGAPILKRVCERYGFPIPDDGAAAMMANGKPCEPGCDQGCGR